MVRPMKTNLTPKQKHILDSSRRAAPRTAASIPPCVRSAAGSTSLSGRPRTRSPPCTPRATSKGKRARPGDSRSRGRRRDARSRSWAGWAPEPGCSPKRTSKAISGSKDFTLGADLLRVKGDSMVGAGILEGDLVQVRRQPAPTTATWWWPWSRTRAWSSGSGSTATYQLGVGQSPLRPSPWLSRSSARSWAWSGATRIDDGALRQRATVRRQAATSFKMRGRACLIFFSAMQSGGDPTAGRAPRPSWRCGRWRPSRKSSLRPGRLRLSRVQGLHLEPSWKSWN